MAGKFIRIRKLVIPMISLIIMCSQLAGCAILESNEMVEMINSGQSITIELPEPSYDVTIQGEKEANIEWIQLDQIKTYNNGFRQDFDGLFKINTVTINNINGKSGCLYVNESNERDGNTTLEDALRNKVFVKYFEDFSLKSALVAIAGTIYADVDGSRSDSLLASINAYYDLLPDYLNPDSFNGTVSLTREEFYTLVFKSEEGVQDIKLDSEFAEAIGGSTENSIYAQEVDQYGFLSIYNSSLDPNNYKGSISRAEAVYMLVQKHFKEELDKVEKSDWAYSDTKNAGDLAYKLGFKEKDENGDKVGKPRWQAYTLAVMVQHPDKGMQDELFRAMVVAKNLGLLGNTEDSRWDEPISKSEAIQLVINVHLAKNSLYGYLSDVEYGMTGASGIVENTGDIALGQTEEGLDYGEGWVETTPVEQGKTSTVDPYTQLPNGLTLKEAKEMIDFQKNLMIKQGSNEADIKEMIEAIAKELGTTIEELESVSEEVPVAENNGNTESTGSSGNTTSNENVTSSNNGNSYNTVPSEFDKNGDGYDDRFDGKGDGSGGAPGESDPDFQLGTVGGN